jgi:hypothetical protein
MSDYDKHASKGTFSAFFRGVQPAMPLTYSARTPYFVRTDQSMAARMLINPAIRAISGRVPSTAALCDYRRLSWRALRQRGPDSVFFPALPETLHRL